MQLNGWQRIWALISVLSCIFTISIVISSIAEHDRPEDLSYYLDSLKNEVITVEIESVGEVHFPDNLSREQIERIIKEAMTSSPNEINEVAEKELKKRAILNAAIARASNANAKESNYQIYSSAAVIWLSFVMFVYALGWSVAWIRRGFNIT